MRTLRIAIRNRTMKLHFLVVICLIYCIKDAQSANYCFNCSSVNDNYCPELMNSDDSGIVPYVSCSNIHEGRFCIKTTGVTGGTLGIQCYRCDDTKETGCSDDLFNAPLSDCKDIFDAYYCIKTIGVYGGSLGTTRFCSSRDLGNYCEYIKRPGDQLEYRSCIFTCGSDGCNSAPGTNRPIFNSIFYYTIIMVVLVVIQKSLL